jgi:cation:H+ antiporter
MSAIDLLLLLLGLVFLVAGAELLVRGAARLAAAFGTSAPELAVSVQSAFAGKADLALGNVVGSNIFNILAVLGLSSIVAPNGVAVARTALAFDIPIMIAVAVACLPIFFSGYLIARWEGALFLAYYFAYTGYLVIHAADHPVLPAFRTAMVLFVIPLTAITLLVIGARAFARARGNGRDTA